MLDALTLDQMRVFVAVAEAGSFRAGAGRLSRVQSAVSHAIGTLENQLGLTLFDRSGHKPLLTREGRALLTDVRAILLKVDALRARAHGLGEGVELGLSIVVDNLFPIAAVAAALRDMRDHYPSVDVRVSTEPLGAPLAALRNRRCTLGIVAGEEFRDPRIEFEALASVSMVAVAAATHPLAAHAIDRARLGSVELADQLQIVLEDPSRLSAGRDFGVLSPVTWRVSGQDTKRSLIIAGIGWGRLPLWSIERDLAEGRLVRLAAAPLGPRGAASVDCFLAHRADEALGPAARRLREALLRHGRWSTAPDRRRRRRSAGR